MSPLEASAKDVVEGAQKTRKLLKRYGAWPMFEEYIFCLEKQIPEITNLLVRTLEEIHVFFER